jgi:hypothetical protein
MICRFYPKSGTEIKLEDFVGCPISLQLHSHYHKLRIVGLPASRLLTVLFLLLYIYSNEITSFSFYILSRGSLTLLFFLCFPTLSRVNFSDSHDIAFIIYTCHLVSSFVIKY